MSKGLNGEQLRAQECLSTSRHLDGIQLRDLSLVSLDSFVLVPSGMGLGQVCRFLSDHLSDSPKPRRHEVVKSEKYSQ